MANLNFLDRLNNFNQCRSSWISLALLLANFATSINAFVVEYNKIGSDESNPSASTIVCETSSCTNTAKVFLNNMDKSVNPCDNFYQFACGNFVKKEILPKGRTTRDIFSITEDNINKKIRSILASSLDERQPRTFKIMQDYYKVCMDTALIEKNSENDLRDILKSLNGWPVLEGKLWNEAKFDWKNTTYALGRSGYSIAFIMNIVIGIDQDDSTKNIIYIDQGSLGTDQEYLSKGLNDPIVKAYFKYMVKFAVLFGADRKKAEKELFESLNFEIAMAKISLSNAERSDDTKLYTKMNIQDLENNYKGISWLEYINNLVQPKQLLTLNDNVMVGPKKFFKNIGALLAKTPKNTIANYIMWSVADSSSDKMSKRVQNLSKEYDKLYFGTAGRRERWEECVDRVHADMAIALSSMYVRKFFDETSKKEVAAMVNNLRNTYEHMIQQVDWMDNETKNSAINKLKVMLAFIGYPSELLDNNKIDEYYFNITINPKSFLKTQIKFNVKAYTFNFATLQKPVNKTDWISHAPSAIVNAFYSPLENSIRFPAGILQGLFFSKDRPKYLNYGSIGMVIGHEMTHGFDNEGSNYDQNGNFLNWWNSETRKKFNAKAQGIVDQYNNFRVEEVHLNVSGKLTEGENIADNGGYKEAYQAYLKWSEVNDVEPGLPGLSYSPKQLFWLSTANLWCTKYLPETLKNIVLTDSHSPGEFRVNGPISNRREFAEDFKCPLGSPMNPIKKYGVCFLALSDRRRSTLTLTHLLAYFVMNVNAFFIEDVEKDTAQIQPSALTKVCITKGCNDTASAFLRNMDKSVKPCDNFYQFACGSFIKTAVSPNGAVLQNLFNIITDVIDEKVRSILEAKLDSRQPRIFKLLQDYYKVCMDEAQIDKNSINDLKGILKSFHGWPVLEGDSWHESKFDWKNVSYGLLKLGYPWDSIINIGVDADQDDSNRNIIYLDQAKTIGDQEYLSKGLKDPIIQAYLKYMVEFAVFLGANPQKARKELLESLNFEIELAKISLSSVERSDASSLFTKMTIHDLQKTSNGIPWLEHLNNIFQPKRLLTTSDKVMVGPKKFFQNIGALLTKTKKSAVANYLLWVVVETSAYRMSAKVQDLANDFNKIYLGTAVRSDRWKICASAVRKDMEIGLSSMYIRKYFDETSKSEVLTLVNNIRSAYKSIIEQVDWMDKKTKAAALEKLKLIKEFIAYPSELLDDKKINEHYKNITIDPKSFLKSKNVLDAREFVREIGRLQKPINKSEWTDHATAATVNAFYFPAENSIQFPAGILQGLFFSKDRPKYLNYGAIGHIIGHEMTHGFDDEGSHYNKHGNFEDWWCPETKKKFNVKAQGIVDQYNKYRIDELNLNVSQLN